MDTDTTSSPPGWASSLRLLGDHLLAGIAERIELFSLELREEKLRQARILAWTCALAFSVIMASTLASVALVFCFWDSARLAVLGGLTAGYGLIAVTLAVAFRRFLSRQPRPFAGTLQELHQDRKWLRRPT